MTPEPSAFGAESGTAAGATARLLLASAKLDNGIKLLFDVNIILQESEVSTMAARTFPLILLKRTHQP
jgi:hypothetical protein